MGEGIKAVVGEGKEYQGGITDGLKNIRNKSWL